VFIITLVNMKLCYHFLLKISFIYSLSVEEKKLYEKINLIAINMKTSDITWKIVILQKISKKNQWIWSYYDRETLVSNFKYRLKMKKRWGNELSVCHVVTAKQLDQHSTATWSRSSNYMYIIQTIINSSQLVKCPSGSRCSIDAWGHGFESHSRKLFFSTFLEAMRERIWK
jgi:hypothetical protein